MWRMHAGGGRRVCMYLRREGERPRKVVSDLIDGMIRLMEGSCVGPVNIGNPNEFTIMQLAEMIRDAIDPNLPLIERSLPQDDPLQRKPLIELARRELGWEPRVGISEGLTQTIEYFRTIL